MDSFISFLVRYVLVLLPLTILAQNYLRLRRIPGPFLASCTDLWRLVLVWRGQSEWIYIALHKKYGDVVRIGPNCVSVSQPDLGQDIYGIGKGFIKSDFYKPWQNIVNGQRAPSLVFTTDEAVHAKMKRPIAQAYSLTTLVDFEPLIDSTTAVFLSQLDTLHALPAKPLDLGLWLQLYAFDVIGELTFSKRLGFLERGGDVDGMMAAVAANFDWNAVVGQMPWLDFVLAKNPLWLKFFAKPVASPIIAFGQRLLAERLSGEEDAALTVSIPDPTLSENVLRTTHPSKPDFLSRFLAAQRADPDLIPQKQLLAYLFMNINAGGDTIASTLRALFHHLLTHPLSLTRLMTELDSSNLTSPLPTWHEVSALPYLNACVKEALRLYPALGLPLERVVPGDGLLLRGESGGRGGSNSSGGTYIPPGTIVGMNPWVLHRDTRIFGPDAEAWNPERWVSAPGDAADAAERVKRMEAHMLSFGAGKRGCLGRNIAMLEMSKVVPALLGRFEFELVEGGRGYKTRNSWIVSQTGLDVRVRRREGR